MLAFTTKSDSCDSLKVNCNVESEFDLCGFCPLLHECEQALGVGDGHGSLACCSPWGSQRVGHDWAIELNWY